MKKGFILLIFALFLVLIYNVSKSRTFQFFGEIIPRVELNERVIALTFDDGPTKETDKILSILREQQIKATFFVTGAALQKHVEEGKKIADSGHELGNHTYSHERMILKSYGFVKREIQKTDSLIRLTGYQGTIHFRPPYGKKLLILPYFLSTQHRKSIMWDVEPESYPEVGKSARNITEHVLEHTKPGSIILLHVMHQDRKESVKSIPGIISGLKKQGYTFLTISELLQKQQMHHPPTAKR